MEELVSIISEISKIEERATKIVQDANEEKDELAATADQRTKDFDQRLQEDTKLKIKEIRSQLEAQVAAALENQKTETEQCLQSLQSEFDQDHKKLAKSILNTLIGA